MTPKVVCCRRAHLRIVAAGNFEHVCAVNDLDPAVHRRIDTLIEFN